jgi:hypothetical protein
MGVVFMTGLFSGIIFGYYAGLGATWAFADEDGKEFVRRHFWPRKKCRECGGKWFLGEDHQHESWCLRGVEVEQVKWEAAQKILEKQGVADERREYLNHVRDSYLALGEERHAN